MQAISPETMCRRIETFLLITLFMSACSGVREAMPIRTGMANVNGTNLYFEVAGEGHPIVLIGGGGSLDRRMWDHQFKAFAKHYRVVRYDPRGIGKSEIPERPFSHSQDLYNVLGFLNVEKTYLVGLSFGGTVAVDFALEHPEKVDALILVGSGLSDFNQAAMQSISGLSLLAKEKGDMAAIKMIVEDPSYIGAENMAARSRAQQILSENAHIFRSNFPHVRLWQPIEPPAGQRLLEIRAPTLVMAGEKDYPAIQEIADRLEAGIVGAKKVVMIRAGHMMNLEKPEEFNRVVLDFLSKL
jgi:pimeloyl-ACP methyl ester carboxylesterase